MNSFTFGTQRPVYWSSVTLCFVLLAALCCCNGLLLQKIVKMADPLQITSESSTMPEMTEQSEIKAVDLGSLLDAGDRSVVTLALKDHFTHLLAETSATTTTDSMPTTTDISAASPTTTTATLAASNATTLPNSDLSWTAASALVPTADCHTLPPDATTVSHLLDTTTTDSMPTTTDISAASSTTTTATPAAPYAPTQPNSDLSWTAASALVPTADCHSLPLDATSVSHLLSLSAEEKGKRLIQVAYEGSVPEVRALLAAGADLEARDHETWTALHWAVERGRVEATRCLLQAGAEVGARTRGQTTPLHVAAWTLKGDKAVLQLLLAANADPNARDGFGWTPLHRAASWGHAEAAAVLLQAGADKWATTNRGETALDIARRTNHSQLTELLQ